MGQKNNVLVDYLKDPDRFADVFNGVIGNGKMIIDPKYLEEADPKYDGPIAVSPETGDRAEEIERISDIKKVYKGGKILQILCLEDQGDISSY